MVSRNGILAFVATATSLALHAAVLSSFRNIRLSGTVPAEARAEEMTVIFDAPAAATTRPFGPEFTIGEAGAKGYASHGTTGDRTATARQADVDQASLSLDPVGHTLLVETPGDAGNGSDRATAEVDSP